MNGRTVLGVDGWKKGWVGIALNDGVFAGAACAPDLRELLQEFPEAVAVGVDMPIGFPSSGPRRADIAARVFVGPRRSSVFPMLPEAVYQAATYEEATAVCQGLWGKGLSKQSFALKDKILEVAEVADRDDRVFEAHPEVSFAAMAGRPLEWPKKSWNGQLLRSRLLANQGLVLPEDLGEVGAAPVDDLLDAAACAWSADRVRTGGEGSLPADPLLGEPVIRF